MDYKIIKRPGRFIDATRESLAIKQLVVKRVFWFIFRKFEWVVLWFLTFIWMK